MKKLLSKSFRPNMDALEDRVTPSATVTIPIPAFLKDGILSITGSSRDDVVAVNLARNGSAVRVTFNGDSKTFVNGSAVRSIVFRGNDGNDVFQNNTKITTTARGGAGNDKLYGGLGANFLYGDAGKDLLFSARPASRSGGGDFLFGGDDDDYLSGSANADYLFGEAGNDTLVGGAGNDTMSGGTGRDFLYGQAGADTLDGGDDRAADYLNGGAGRDKFQMEGHGKRNQIAFYFNLDDPVDFSAAEDSFFGEDRPVATRATGGVVIL